MADPERRPLDDDRPLRREEVRPEEDYPPASPSEGARSYESPPPARPLPPGDRPAYPDERPLDPARHAHGYEEHSTVVERPAPGVVRTTSATAHTVSAREAERERRAAKIGRIKRVLNFIASAFTVIILFRFFLKALGANPDNPFASFVYSVSQPLVAPFLSLFNPYDNGSIVIEISSLVAIAAYYLLAYAIGRLVELTVAPLGHGE